MPEATKDVATSLEKKLAVDPTFGMEHKNCMLS